jgi:hypothetical protein
MTQELATEYLEDHVTEFLFDYFYQNFAYYKIVFPNAVDYISIVHKETGFIRENLYNSERSFINRFRYPQLNPEQRLLIICTLRTFVGNSHSNLIRWLNHGEKTKRSQGHNEDDVKGFTDRMNRQIDCYAELGTLMENEWKAVTSDISFFWENIVESYENISINDYKQKISFLKDKIQQIKGNDYYLSYPAHYHLIIEKCKAAIKRLKITKSNLLETDNLVNKMNKSANKYTMPIYALLHYYLSKKNEGKVINGDNRDKIAKGYGFESSTSGIALFNEFGKFKIDGNRLNLSQTKKTDSTMQKNFIKVIEILKEQNSLKSLQLAKDEYLIFSTKFERYYN